MRNIVAVLPGRLHGVRGQRTHIGQPHRRTLRPEALCPGPRPSRPARGSGAQVRGVRGRGGPSSVPSTATHIYRSRFGAAYAGVTASLPPPGQQEASTPPNVGHTSRAVMACDACAHPGRGTPSHDGGETRHVPATISRRTSDVTSRSLMHETASIGEPIRACDTRSVR
jgi:hypothetical protein